MHTLHRIYNVDECFCSRVPRDVHRHVARLGERDGAVRWGGRRCNWILLAARPVAVPTSVAAVLSNAVVIQAIVVTGRESASPAAPPLAVHRARGVARRSLPLARRSRHCNTYAVRLFITECDCRLRLRPRLGNAAPISTALRAGVVIRSAKSKGVQARKGALQVGRIPPSREPLALTPS